MIRQSDDVTPRVVLMHQRIIELQRREKTGTGGLTADSVLDEVLADLQVSLEELQVAEEVVRTQSEELMMARNAVELERHRYQDLFDFAPDPYLVTDVQGKIIEANNASSEMFGIPLEFLRKKPLGTYVAQESRRLFRQHLNAIGTMRTKEEWELRLQPRHRTPFDALLTVAPIRDRNGMISGLRWMIRDISLLKEAGRQIERFNFDLEERVGRRTGELEDANQKKDRVLRREQEARLAAEEMQRRFRFLAEAGEIMSSSLQYETTLETVAHMAVPRLGDWCFVDIVEEDDSIWRLAVAAADPAQERLGKKMLGDYTPGESMRNRLLANAIATGRSELVPEVTDELLQVITQDSHHLELLRKLAPKSLMVIPLVTRGRTLGAITLVATSRPCFTGSDLDLAEELAHRAALAVDNARLFRRAQLEIEERERIEISLRRSKARFRRLVDSNLFGVVLSRLDGAIIDANDAFLSMIGYTRDEMRNGDLRAAAITAPEYREGMREIMNRLLADGICPPVQKEYIARDGRRVTALLGAAMLEDGDEMICFVLDISDRVRTEAHLQRQVRQLEAIYRLSSAVARAGSLEEICRETMAGLLNALSIDRVAILLFDSLGVMRFRGSHGLSEKYRNAVEGHSPWTRDQADPEPIRIADVAADATLGTLRDVVMAEGIGSLAFIPLVYNGQLLGKFMLYRNTPHEFSDEEIQVAMTAASHVSFVIGRKAIEEELIISESRFRRLANSNVIGIITASFEGKITEANDEFLRMVGYTREDLDAGDIDWIAMTPPEYLSQDLAMIEQLRSTEHSAPFEKEYYRRDGSRLPVLLGMALLDQSRGETVCFVLDITAHHQMDRALREAKEVAEAANSAKDHFLAVLSHELRTPLTPILAMAQALREDEGLPDEFRPMLDVICRNAELEATLIDDLLDLTRIVKGKLKLKRGTVDAHELIGSAVEICRAAIGQKKIDVRLNLAAGRHAIHADPARIHQILWNILNNAVRFTPVDGVITISTSNAADGMFSVEIADSGIGIDPDDLGRIFGAFEQVKLNGGRSGGLGLGLAISRALVEAHDGTIRVTSEGQGKGTTFTVTLPPVAPHEAAVAPPEGKAAPVTILVVDDHEDTRRVMELMLSRHGYRVVTASGVEHALKIAAERDFQILLSDIGLADGSGLDLVRMIRANHDIRSIAVSGYRSDEDIRACREAGFDEVMNKPVDSTSLRAMIDRLVRG
ncbi:MAG: domain S-box [Chlorobi bacterium]|nr:domain S-box [Chlorobiota bacterium]